MIVEARTKRTNIDKDNSRLDLFLPRFKHQPLMSVHIGFEGRPIKFFSELKDLPKKCITIHKSIVNKTNRKKTPLIRGAIYRCGYRCECCEEEAAVYIYMPEQVIK